MLNNPTAIRAAVGAATFFIDVQLRGISTRTNQKTRLRSDAVNASPVDSSSRLFVSFFNKIAFYVATFDAMIWKNGHWLPCTLLYLLRY